jgi:lytic murein transglycosylase
MLTLTLSHPTAIAGRLSEDSFALRPEWSCCPVAIANTLPAIMMKRVAGLCKISRLRSERDTILRHRIAVFCLSLLIPTAAQAVKCGGDFPAFINAISAEAVNANLPPAIVTRALASVSPDKAVLAFDHRQQRVFNKSFEYYAAIAVTPQRTELGRKLLRKNAALLSRIERDFGVPAPVIVAIWGLETHYGTKDLGTLPVIRTLTTLAYDCRRTELFQSELLAALQILQRGDLSLRDMIGGNAGEIGQTQFLPSSYLKYGIDYDKDGHVNLRHSVPDVLASTANFLKANGRQPNAPFGEGTANFDVMRS